MLMEVKRQQGQEAGAGLLQWLLALVPFQTTYAQLHAYLQQVAGTARMLFEKALERVAIAEGLPLPHVPAASSPQGA